MNLLPKSNKFLPSLNMAAIHNYKTAIPVLGLIVEKVPHDKNEKQSDLPSQSPLEIERYQKQ